MEKKFIIVGKAKEVGRTVGEDTIVTEIGVWTDGIGLYCDNEPFCAYRLIPGKHYKITVERVKEVG